MREDLETREEWEFSGEEENLRELRGALSVKRSRRKSNSGVAVSVILVGGLVGVAGVGGYYGMNLLLPPLPTEDTLASSSGDQVQVASTTAPPDPAQPASQNNSQTVAPADVPAPAGAESPVEVAANTTAPDAPTAPGAPEGVNGGASALVDVAADNAAPSDVASPAEAVAPVDMASNTPSPSVPSAQDAAPSSMGDPASLEVAVNDTAPRDVASSGALSDGAAAPHVAMGAASAPEVGGAPSGQAPQAMEMASLDPVATIQTPGAVGASPSDGSSPSAQRVPVADASLNASGEQPKSAAASPSGARAHFEGNDLREIKGVADVAALNPEAFDARVTARSPVAGASLDRRTGVPEAPIRPADSTNRADATTATDTGQSVRSVRTMLPLPAEPSAPGAMSTAALSGDASVSGRGAGDVAPQIASRPLASAPQTAEAASVAAPSGEQVEIAIANPIQAPNASRPAFATPFAPEVSTSGGFGGASADAPSSLRAAAPTLQAEPGAPDISVVAALHSGANPVGQPSPAVPEGGDPTRSARQGPAVFESVLSVEVASIEPVSPQFANSQISAHAAYADGAGTAGLTSPLLDYQTGLKEAAKLIDQNFADGRSPQIPNASSAPGAPVQVASVSLLAPVITAAPSEEVAAGSSFDLFAIGGAPTETQSAPVEAITPEYSLTKARPYGGHEPAIVIASISLSNSFVSELGPEDAASFAALIDVAPRFDPPSTPNISIDPTAAILEPSSTLTIAPQSSAPALAAPVMVASLGVQSIATPGSGAAPRQSDVNYLTDFGREEALKAITALKRRTEPKRAAPVDDGWVDERPAWVRNGVAPPLNPQGLPVMAIVIDEIGAYGASIEDVTSLPTAVSVSVIPSTENAARTVKHLRFSRREVLVHMPFEANGDAELGPRPILTGMSDIQVQETAHWHLTQFDNYIGVNTHRGSKATTDRRVMEAAAPLMAQRGLLFLDSRNAEDSVAEEVAREAGMLTAANNFFIDEKTHTSGIYRQLDAAAEFARKNGAAIAIGNPHKVTIQAVKAWMKKHDGVRVLVAPLTHVAQVANGVPSAEIVVAGTPPDRPAPRPRLEDVASDLSGDAAQSIKSTLSGIAASIGQSLFNR